MPTNDYLRLIQRNHIIPYANNGFQRSHWCFAITLMDASVKQFQISVLANSGAEATQYANQLKVYLEANPMPNDDVSIGLRPPIWDPDQHAYRVDMIMMTGNLMVVESVESAKYSPFSCGFGCGFFIETKPYDRDAYMWQFSTDFCTATCNRTTAKLGLQPLQQCGGI
jgi:hypothetical protein